MIEHLNTYWIAYVAGIVIGLIWLSIHYYWKNEEKKGRELSEKAKEWMVFSKFAAVLFFIFPVIAIPALWLFDSISVFLFSILIIIALLSFVWKGK